MKIIPILLGVIVVMCVLANRLDKQRRGDMKMISNRECDQVRIAIGLAQQHVVDLAVDRDTGRPNTNAREAAHRNVLRMLNDAAGIMNSAEGL